MTVHSKDEYVVKAWFQKASRWRVFTTISTRFPTQEIAVLEVNIRSKLCKRACAGADMQIHVPVCMRARVCSRMHK